MRDDQKSTAPQIDLEELVAESDFGGRQPTGLAYQILMATAIAWSLFQLWFASPLPFMLGVGIFNDTQARSIHLGFALFLAFTSYPAFKSSPRQSIPLIDWIFAIAGAFAGAYLFIFYRELAVRPGQPTDLDLITARVGLVLLLEATRR